MDDIYNVHLSFLKLLYLFIKVGSISLRKMKRFICRQNCRFSSRNKKKIQLKRAKQAFIFLIPK